VTRTLALAKYQASGNDFLIVDGLGTAAPAIDVPALCDRWFGIGADGVIVVGPGSAADFAFALTNADGTAAQMSGNGMRCVGAWLRDTQRVAHGASFDVETPAGVKHVWLTLDGATVGMGQPNFTKAAIPMYGPAWETFQDQAFDAGDGRTMRATALSMGNPHLSCSRTRIPSATTSSTWVPRSSITSCSRSERTSSSHGSRKTA